MKNLNDIIKSGHLGPRERDMAVKALAAGDEAAAFKSLSAVIEERQSALRQVGFWLVDGPMNAAETVRAQAIRQSMDPMSAVALVSDVNARLKAESDAKAAAAAVKQ